MADKRLFTPDIRREYAYSEWHRTQSLGRFIGQGAARKCWQEDLDAISIGATLYDSSRQGWIEWAAGCKPIIITETKEARGPADRFVGGTDVLKALVCDHPFAQLVGVRYVLAEDINPCSPMRCLDIAEFRVQRLHPFDATVTEYGPQQMAELILSWHTAGTEAVKKGRRAFISVDAAARPTGTYGDLPF